MLLLMLLNTISALDTVDHSILLDRLENWVELSGTVLSWFRSYLQDRNYLVSIGNYVSGLTYVTILEPSLFSLYMLLLGLIMQNNIDYHCYADNTQIYSI